MQWAASHVTGLGSVELDGHWPVLSVDKVLRLMRHAGAEVLADDRVPRRSEPDVELVLEEARDILLDGRLQEGPVDDVESHVCFLLSPAPL